MKCAEGEEQREIPRREVYRVWTTDVTISKHGPRVGKETREYGAWMNLKYLTNALGTKQNVFDNDNIKPGERGNWL